jgi:hypothetical protein
MRWAGHVARVGERRDVYRVLVGKPEGRRPGIDGTIILRWIFRKWDWGMDWIDLNQGRGRWRPFIKCGNKPAGSIK